MGRVFVVELEGRCYRCKHCNCPLALSDDVISRKFNCRKGRAYLFKKVVNVSVGRQEERMMLTGMHTVEDVLCCCCGQLLGWKYVAAQDTDQRYKEGKFVLERWRIADEVSEELHLDGHQILSDGDSGQDV
ncbi:hypothetical protein K2173_001572 [Erythroxylum novogranatense]|uniref:Protein yippee-like n=1 Tax=Erythroxylum novogranatense TaxID=1862640 RepID=A0AAV8T3W2_9ROSI|nr:hypothetical protein K2173_001572 [Erythroxylum novogranatense]